MKQKLFSLFIFVAFFFSVALVGISIKAATTSVVETDKFIKQGEWLEAYGLPGDQLLEGDYNGDGKTDILLGRPLASQQNQYRWWMILSTGSAFEANGEWLDAYGLPGDTFLVGDYNGDNKTDILIGRPLSSQQNQLRWWAMTSKGNGFNQGGVWLESYGLPGDTFIVGDYDDSGEDDVLIGRSLAAQQHQFRWWVMLADDSGDGFVEDGMWLEAYGLPGDRFLTGKFNNDDKVDILIGRPLEFQSNQYRWWVMSVNDSANGFDQGGVWLESYGLAGDEILVGDYNKDSLTDLMLARPLTSQQNQYRWWGALSNGIELNEDGVWVEAAGVGGDMIKVGDFNGDGKTDIALARPIESQNNQLRWWVMTSNIQTEDNYEENDTKETAYELNSHEGEWLSSVDGPGIQNDADWYEIYITSGYQLVNIKAKFTHSEGDINIGLYGGDGTELATATSTTDDETIEYLVSAGDTSYYVKVYNEDAGNTYDLWWEGTNQSPSISILEPDGAADTTDTSYDITWTDDDPDNDASISLYYDSDDTGEDGTLITSGISENDASDSYTWDTSALPEGSYYIYGIIDDGINPQVVDYSGGAVTVNHLTTCTSIICNPSFEDGFDFWTTNGTPDNQISSDAVDGVSSLYSEHTRTVSDSPVWSGVSQIISVVEPAQTYGISIWIKSLNVAQAHIKIKWYDLGGGIIQVDYPITNINGTNSSWISLSKLVISPASAASAEIFITHGINVSSQNVQGSTLWADNIEFDVATTACGTLCNENFEQGLLYWLLSGKIGSHSIETSGAYDGDKTAKSEQQYTGGDPATWAGITQYAQVKEGTDYRLRLWLKTLDAVNGHVRIRWRDDGGSILSTEYPIGGINGTNATWYSVESALTAPADAAKAEVTAWHGVTGGTTNVPGSTLWIDNITLICEDLCNGGFEDGSIHWETNGKNEGEIMTAGVKEGLQAIKVVQSLDSSDTTQWAGVSQRTLVTGGESYDLSFWIKKDSVTQGHVKIKWRDSDDQLISQQFPIAGITGTDMTWTQMSTTIAAPANAETAEIFIWHGVDSSNENATGSTLYIDDVIFLQTP